MISQSKRCQCFDPGCNIHHDGQCKERASATLYRIDQDDQTGTRFCEGCSGDAATSGLFTDNIGDDDDDNQSTSSVEENRSSLESAERRWAKGAE